MREPKGWVCFDAVCGLCTGLAQRWRQWLAGLGFHVVPIQEEWVRERMNWEPIREPALITRDDRLFLGSDVFFEIARNVGWARPVYWVSLLPGVRPVCRWIYRAVASRRYRFSNVCAMGKSRAGRWHLYFALAMLVLMGLIGTTASPGWETMWALAGLLWLGLKLALLPTGPVGRRWLWFAWPGTDAARFFTKKPKAFAEDWIAGTANLLIGLGLCWIATLVPPLIGAWLLMAAIVFVLHFGCFRILSGWFRAGGIEARPIMEFPLLAKSLSDFWGNRWNRGFNVPARRYLFAPLVRRRGVGVATMAVFGVSGLLHELVISLPAGAGYGGPLSYFLIQGLGVLAERRVRVPWLRRSLAIAVLLLPLGLLFHPPFIHNVMLPMLEVVSAIGKDIP